EPVRQTAGICRPTEHIDIGRIHKGCVIEAAIMALSFRRIEKCCGEPRRRQSSPDGPSPIKPTTHIWIPSENTQVAIRYQRTSRIKFWTEKESQSRLTSGLQMIVDL